MSERKIESPEYLEKMWEAYKKDCDENKIYKSVFNQKEGHYVTELVSHPLSYDIVGLCVKCGISKQAFYKNYMNDPDYVDLVNQIQSECEIRTRQNLENGYIASSLGGLFMSKHGYTTKTEVKTESNVSLEKKDKESLGKELLEKVKGNIKKEKE